jgi:hypothetical protein
LIIVDTCSTCFGWPTALARPSIALTPTRVRCIRLSGVLYDYPVFTVYSGSKIVYFASPIISPVVTLNLKAAPSPAASKRSSTHGELHCEETVDAASHSYRCNWPLPRLKSAASLTHHASSGFAARHATPRQVCQAATNAHTRRRAHVPATEVGRLREASTTMLSTTTSLHAVPAEPRISSAVAKGALGCEMQRPPQAREPRAPQRTRYERRREPKMGNVSLAKP